jgi:hypothetical protein
VVFPKVFQVSQTLTIAATGPVWMLISAALLLRLFSVMPAK